MAARKGTKISTLRFRKLHGAAVPQNKFSKIQKAAWGGCASVRPLVICGEVVELEEVGWPPSCGISAFSIACLSAA